MSKRLTPDRLGHLLVCIGDLNVTVQAELRGHLDAVEAELAEAMSALDKAATANGQMFLDADQYRKRAEAAEARVLRISQLYNGWANAANPEGLVATLSAIGEALGDPFE